MTLSVLAAIGVVSIAMKVEERTEKKTKRRIGLALNRFIDGTATEKDMELLKELYVMGKK